MAQHVKETKKYSDPFNRNSALQLVFLEYLTTIKYDIDLNIAGMLYSTSLRVLGGFLSPVQKAKSQLQQ